MKEASYYEKEPGEKVKCFLCPHNCIIRDGRTGLCGVRTNKGGVLYSMIYGEVSALATDPIEKKPLYHFCPGNNILSIGTKGCNFKCSYCQNWHISQDLKVKTSYYEPVRIIETAARSNSMGIAYTYSEPLIWFEYLLECSMLAKDKGLKNIYVTNGFINPDPLEELLPYTDAMNIDLKSFREDTYKKIQMGRLSDVKRTIEKSLASCHVELTTLIVTGINDNMEEMKDIINWIASLDKNIPWHISRYYPSYQYDAPPTDTGFMYDVYDEAVKKLNFVYCGNIASRRGTGDTHCPSCNSLVIKRNGYSVAIKGLNEGKCANCGTVMPIVC